MAWNFDMAEAPKDQPILAWCDNSMCDCARARGCLYHAHADGLSHVEDGPHVIEWGGSFTDTGEYGEVLAEMPDWWFRWDSEWEVAANPIAWQLIEPVKIPRCETPAEITRRLTDATTVTLRDAIARRSELMPHMPWLTEDDVP